MLFMVISPEFWRCNPTYRTSGARVFLPVSFELAPKKGNPARSIGVVQ